MQQSTTPINDDLWGAVHNSPKPSPTKTKETPMSANTNTQNAADTVTGAAEEVKEAAANAANKVAAPFKRSHWKSLVGDTMIVTGTVAVVGGVAYLGFRYIPRLFNRGE